MQKTLEFGKVDYNHSGRKNCRVTVKVGLQEGYLRICGWDALVELAKEFGPKIT